MTKAERVIAAARELADALDDVGVRRTHPLFATPMINVQVLRDEADWYERQARAWEGATRAD